MAMYRIAVKNINDNFARGTLFADSAGRKAIGVQSR